jgi:hypothetical protein
VQVAQLRNRKKLGDSWREAEVDDRGIRKVGLLAGLYGVALRHQAAPGVSTDPAVLLSRVSMFGASAVARPTGGATFADADFVLQSRNTSVVGRDMFGVGRTFWRCLRRQ